MNNPRINLAIVVAADLILAAFIATFVASLTSCGSEYPIRLGIRGNHGTYSYSPTDGISIDVNASSK